MTYAISFSGPAGSGANTSGLIIAQILAEKGYQIMANKEYQSIIKGGNNNFTVYINTTTPTLTKKIDLFIAFDKFSIEKNTSIFNIQQIEDISTIKMKQKNIFAIGIAGKLINIEKKDIITFIKKKLKNKYTKEHEEALNLGYEYKTQAAVSRDFGKTEEEKVLLFGNQTIADGAIASGLDFYSFYPMTPASTIAAVINKNPKTIDSAIAKNMETTDKHIVSFQAGDEIAVAMAMLGANFAGKRAMCGTSGGGFALMCETIAMAHQTEIGSVYILSQRDGPSTGTPTFTSQTDINFALNPTFGDTKPIVLYPSNHIQAYNLIGKALNRAKKYQHPIIVLLDKQFSESYTSIDKKDLIAEPIHNGEKKENPTEEYARYKFTQSGISPYTIPGTPNGEFCGTSYEHNEYGESIEDPINKKEMTKKRFQKLTTFSEKEFNEDYYGYEIHNPDAKKLFITTGPNYYVCKSFIKKNPTFGLISIHLLHPFDQRLSKFLSEHRENIDKLIFIELNYSGQLEELVIKEAKLHGEEREKKISNLRKNELYPVFEEELEQFLK